MPRAKSVAPPQPKPKPQSRLSRAKSAAPSKSKSKYNENREYSHATKSDEEEYVPKDKCPVKLRTSARQRSMSCRVIQPELPIASEPLRRSSRAPSIIKVNGPDRRMVEKPLPNVPSEDLPLDHEARKLWAIFVVRLRTVHRGQSDWAKVPKKVKIELAEMVALVIAAVDE